MASFSLFPIHSYSRLSLPLDNNRFKTFVQWVRNSKEWRKSWKHPNDSQIWWNYWFNLDDAKIIRKNENSKFASSITTNGVQVSFLFSDKKVPTIQEEKRKERKQMVEKKEKEKNSNERKIEQSKEEKKTKTKSHAPTLTKLQKKNEKSNVLLEYQLEDFPQVVYEKKFDKKIGVDPGSHKLVTACDSETKSIHHFTKKQYYHESKMNLIQQRSKYHFRKEYNENKEFKNAFDKTTNHCWKISNPDTYLITWKDHISYENAMWEFYGKRMWSKWNFLIYRFKRKTLDKICRVITNTEGKTNEEILVGYGAAKFKTSMKNQKPGPLSAIVRRLSSKPNITIVMVDEYKTSQTCSDETCQNKLKKYKSTRMKRKKREKEEKKEQIIWKKRKKEEKSICIRTKEEKAAYRRKRRKKCQYAKHLKYEFSKVTNEPIYNILTCPSCKKCRDRDYIASENISRILHLISTKQSRPPAFVRMKDELIENENEEINNYLQEISNENNLTNLHSDLDDSKLNSTVIV